MIETLQNLSPKELIELLKKQQKESKKLQKQSNFLQRQSDTLQKQSDTLQQTNDRLHQENELLRQMVEKFKQLAFGKKRERFEHPDQPQLPFDMPEEEVQQLGEETIQKISYERKKKSDVTHPGRTKLPDHLPVEEVHLYPEGDLTDMICIGQEVTEELDIKPAVLFVRRYIRHKYKAKNEDLFSIAPAPERLLHKHIAGRALIASVLVDKYVYHLPLYRILQRFKQGNVQIASSTLEGWVRDALKILNILYEQLLKQTKAKGYLQADETTIKVQDRTKKGKCHQGYYWVYHCPLDGTVLFDYQPGRSAEAAAHVLDGFRGYLQSDGYGVYERVGRQPGVTHLCCWAHARREFFNALPNDKERASIAMGFIQALYNVEAEAKGKNLSAAARKELRLSKSLPQINAFAKWMKDEYSSGKILPKSAMGKAISYTVNRWEQLSAYLNDGSLEIDNNLVENAIRPLAIGRKNYLFAGSHEAAKRAASIYSFFAMCKKEDVNPYEWLNYAFEKLSETKMTELHLLLPKHFKTICCADQPDTPSSNPS